MVESARRKEQSSRKESGGEAAAIASLALANPGSAIEAWLDMNRSWANGVAEVGREWASFAESQTRRALEAGARIGGCRGIDEVIAVQGEVMGESARAGLERMQRISELSAQLVWSARPRA